MTPAIAIGLPILALLAAGCMRAVDTSVIALPNTRSAAQRATASGTIYVINFVSNSMTSFAAGGSQRLLTITNLDEPRRVAVDSTGLLYVGAASGFNVYKPGERQLAYQLDGAGGSSPIAIDANNDAFVSAAGPQVNVYQAGSPLIWRHITSGLEPGAVVTGIGIAPNQNIYLVQIIEKRHPRSETAQVAEYRATDFSLVRTIGAGLDEPDRIAFDSSGDAFVTNPGNNTVTEYAPGRTSPKLVISAGINGPEAIVLDASDNVYVANYNANSVSVYKPGSKEVSRTIAKGIVRPRAMLFDNATNLYVATSEGVKIYAPGSSTPTLRLGKKDGVRAPVGLAYNR